jgi:8-oxo-dGTP pyrophosphatase MutT (NUDIX family)
MAVMVVPGIVDWVGEQMKKGPFVETSRSTKYETAWLRVEEATVIRPDGSSGLFGLAHVVPGVTVVALDHAYDVLLVREYKYGVERETIELVSGAIDSGETPIEAGLRELHEETGFVAGRATYIGAVDPFTTIVSGRIHIILAEDLAYRPGRIATDDIVEPMRVSFQRALAMVENGAITHAPSCVALLRAERMRPLPF